MAKPSAIRSIRDSRAGINLLVYGDNGVGKTPFIGTSPDGLILNCDSPDAVMSAKVAGSTCDVWQIRDWGDAEEAHEYLRHTASQDYRWVWCDSLTGLDSGGLESIMEDLVAAKPHRDRYVPDMPQYLQNMNRIRTWVRNMSGLPFNFGITAHPFRWNQEIDEEDEEMIWPWVRGKGMPADICGYMNVIGYLRIRKLKTADGTRDVQTLYTKNLPKYYARDRFSALKSPWNNPSIPMIEKAIMEKVGGSVRENKLTPKTSARPVARPAAKAAKAIRPVAKATTARKA